MQVGVITLDQAALDTVCSMCPDLIDHRDLKGVTALMTASAMSHLAVVKRLIDARASVNSPDYKGRTPLITAVGVGAHDVVEALCAAGANLALTAERGRSALHAAVEYNSVDIVRVLIEHGVNINAQDANHRTALHIATEMQASRRGDVSLLVLGVTFARSTFTAPPCSSAKEPTCPSKTSRFTHISLYRDFVT